jgi:hypothetical protein
LGSQILRLLTPNGIQRDIFVTLVAALDIPIGLPVAHQPEFSRLPGIL